MAREMVERELYLSLTVLDDQSLVFRVSAFNNLAARESPL